MRVHPVEEIPTEDPLVLSGPDAHHLIRVLRARAGERWILQSARGERVLAQITDLQRDRILLRRLETLAPFPRKRTELWLATAVPKGNRWPTLLRGCVEAGVDRILPTHFARTQPHASAPDLERAQRLLHETIKQCGRPAQITIDPPCSLQELPTTCHALLLDSSPSPTWVEHAAHLPTDRPWLLLIGPEGGLTDEERETLRARQVETVTLGPTTYRIETAAIAACAIASSWLWTPEQPPPHPPPRQNP